METLAALRKECGGAKDARVASKLKERLGEAKRDSDEIKRSRYALGKNPENLTQRQKDRLPSSSPEMAL